MIVKLDDAKMDCGKYKYFVETRNSLVYKQHNKNKTYKL